MKVIHYLFSVILSLMFVSCSHEYDNCSALSFKTSLPVEQTKSELRSTDSGKDSLFAGTVEPSQETVMEFCTGKDLEWYNGTTGELKFKNDVGKNTVILSFLAYLDEEFLFGLRFISGYMSYVVNMPVLTQDLDGRYYISKGYPRRDEYLNEEDYWLSEKCWKTEREENWKNLVESEGWKLFIEQLKKEGRYKK